MELLMYDQAPFGQSVEIVEFEGRPVRHVVVNDAEQAIIEQIKQLRLQGISVRMIVNQFNEEGVPCRGSRWHKTTVNRILRRMGKA